MGGSVERGLEYFSPQLFRSVKNIISNLLFVKIDKGTHIRTVLFVIVGGKKSCVLQEVFGFLVSIATRVATRDSKKFGNWLKPMNIF